MLRKMRMEEEGLDRSRGGRRRAARQPLRAGAGLPLHPDRRLRVALAAWKVGGHPDAIRPQIACSGTPVRGQLDEWLKLAKDDTNLCNTLKQLHEAVRQRPHPGQLVLHPLVDRRAAVHRGAELGRRRGGVAAADEDRRRGRDLCPRRRGDGESGDPPSFTAVHPSRDERAVPSVSLSGSRTQRIHLGLSCRWKFRLGNSLCGSVHEIT